jgi:hypothetical protein
MKPALRACALVLCAFLIEATPPFAAAQQPQYSMGLVLEDPDTYERLPKAPKYRAVLPERVDLSSRFPPPGDQKQQGSCTAWAVAYGARSYYDGLANGQGLSSQAAFSPAYIFNQLQHSDPAQCAGSSIVDALNLLVTQGVARMDEFPYTDRSCSQVPSARLRASAALNRIRSFKSISRGQIETVKGELYRGNPVIVAMATTNNFHWVRGSAVFNDVRSNTEGHHAMNIVGYDDQKGAFKLLNSWGRDWGDGGYGWVDYEAMAQRGVQYYVMQVDAPPKPPEPPAPPPQPPPPAPTVEEIRQKVRQLTARMECSSIEPQVASNGDVVLRGFTGSTDRLGEVLRSISLVPGVRDVQQSLSVAPWPQCEAYLTLASIKQDPKLLSATIAGASNNKGSLLRDRDQFAFEITPQSTGGYMYVSYLQANGDQVPLVSGRQYASGQTVKLPANPQRYTISAPFGDELLIIMTSPKPLFSADFGKSDDRQYLSLLRRVLLNLSPADRSQLMVAVLPIKTIPR